MIIGAAVIGGGSLWAADEIGVLNIEDSGEEVGEFIGNLVAGVVGALPIVVAEVAPATIEALAGSVDATREALRGRETHAFAALTVVVVSIACYWGLKGSLLQQTVTIAAP